MRLRHAVAICTLLGCAKTDPQGPIVPTRATGARTLATAPDVLTAAVPGLPTGWWQQWKGPPEAEYEKPYALKLEEGAVLIAQVRDDRWVLRSAEMVDWKTTPEENWKGLVNGQPWHIKRESADALLVVDPEGKPGGHLRRMRPETTRNINELETPSTSTLREVCARARECCKLAGADCPSENALNEFGDCKDTLAFLAKSGKVPTDRCQPPAPLKSPPP